MLEIVLPEMELFNEATEEFVYAPKEVFHLEHSLLSLAKWEEQFHKPFLSDAKKTPEEMKAYFSCMCLDSYPDPSVWNRLTQDDYARIVAYLEDSHSGTTFSSAREQNQNRRGETPSAELIYYWMIASEIPFTCESWNLNRLMTLIRICSIKNNPEKMSKKDIYKRNAALNKARRH